MRSILDTSRNIGYTARRGNAFTFIPPIDRLKLCYRMYSMQQANSPYGRGHRGKKFCSSANVSFTFALKIFVSGVKEWYIKNAKISVLNTFISCHWRRWPQMTATSSADAPPPFYLTLTFNFLKIFKFNLYSLHLCSVFFTRTLSPIANISDMASIFFLFVQYPLS